MPTRIVPASTQLFDNCSALQAQTALGIIETLVLASAVTRLNSENDAVVASGAIYLTPGKGCTGVIVRFREGYGIAGAIDWEPAGLPYGVSVTPGVVNAIPIAAVLNAAYQQTKTGGQYSVTVQQCGVDVMGNAVIVNASIAWFAATWTDIE